MNESTNLANQNRKTNTITYLSGVVVILGSMLLIMSVMIHRKAIDPEALANYR